MTDFTGAQIFLGRIAVSPFALAKFLQIFKRDLRKKPQQIGRGCITIDERKDGPSMCRAQSGCGGYPIVFNSGVGTGPAGRFPRSVSA